MTDVQPPADPRQRRRIRWTAAVLALVALGIYVAFIAASVMRAQP